MKLWRPTRRRSERRAREADELQQEREAFVQFVQTKDWGHMGSFLFDELLRTRQIRMDMQRSLRRIARGLVAAAVLLALLAGYDARQQSVNHDVLKQLHSVQATGEPVAVCLREGIERVLPALERLPGAAPPLAAYVRLQRKRYVGVRCPVER